jgi:replicative DNA helicase
MANQSYPARANTQILAAQIPFSQEAEEAVIGAVLVNPDVFLAVASFLQSDDFYLIRNRLIWDALFRIMNRNDKIDYVTVLDELRVLGKLNEIGGPAYLTTLINSTPTSIHAEVYGRMVERASLRRRLLAAADEIKSLAMDESLPIEKVTDESESKLFNVTERKLKREIIGMGDAINEYFDHIEYLMQNQDAPLGLPTGFRDLDGLLGGLQKSDLLIFAGRPGMGKCVAEGTVIPTSRGLLPIEALKPEGEMGIPDDEGGMFYPLDIDVQTPAGMRRASHFYDSGLKPTLKIKTRAGYTLTGTHIHPILTLSPDGAQVWKPIAEIQQGDFVAIQRHDAIWAGELELPAFTFSYYWSNVTHKPNLLKDMSEELAYMLGLLAGDGNLTRKNYVSFSTAEPELLKLFYEWATSLGLKARHRAAYDHTIGSVVLNTWLKHIGLSGYAYEKEVPFTILRAPQECIRAFLQGLFDTDGHAEAQRGHIQYVSSSQKLARQIHLLLLQFGIVSKLTFKPNKYRGAWSIRITGDAARHFYERIGFRLERKQARYQLLPTKPNANLDVIPYLPKRQSSFPKKLNYTRYFRGEKQPTYPTLQQIALYAHEVHHLLEPEFYWDEITEVADAGLQHCYDLTVPDGHAFVANGIVSHNTSFLLSVALNAAKLGARVAIFTMEMGHEQITARLVSMETAPDKSISVNGRALCRRVRAWQASTFISTIRPPSARFRCARNAAVSCTNMASIS